MRPTRALPRLTADPVAFNLATKQEKRTRHRPPVVVVPLIIAAPRASLEVPIAPGKKEAVVVLEVVAHNEVIGRMLARDEAALGVVVQHRDELGADRKSTRLN